MFCSVCFVSGSQGQYDMTQATEREQIEQRISRLAIIEKVRGLALPLAAGSAGIGVFAPPFFTIGAGFAALTLGLGEVYASTQRKILDRQLNAFKNRYGDEAGARLSSSTNRLTVR